MSQAATGELHYEITGAGPRIALLHPVGLDLTLLAPVADILSDDFTVLTVDQRGHGRSHAATQARSLEDYADDLNALFATLPMLPSIRTPTLCIAGEHDKSSPPPVVWAIADAVPGARFAVIGGAPHMLFIEQPEETARLIREFLRDVA